ncbi:Alpha/Beta hydrolase protein [Coniochaeta sp. 2T2.1]|nr:Alpha/Beta hydrolase protein [Coniochaeta sp. 2T2.1]
MPSLGDWVCTLFPPFRPTLFPNIAFWSATSASNSPVAFGQPDSVVVSIGYPPTESVYDFIHRVIGYRPPHPTPPEYLTGADAFISFLDGSLRPWVYGTLFLSVTFTRDALFGHSFGGLFVVHALISNPYIFDTYLSARLALDWQNGSIFAMRNITLSEPAVLISYGSLEEFPVRRRTETEEQLQTRKDFFKPLRMTGNCHQQYVRHDHAGVAASVITDGIDYFVNW